MTFHIYLINIITFLISYDKDGFVPLLDFVSITIKEESVLLYPCK